MEQIKVSLPHELKLNVVARVEELGLGSTSEYFRLLANLDISIQRYQKLTTYISMLYSKINEINANMGIYAMPLQEVQIVKLENNV